MTDIKQLAKNLRRYKRRKLIERLREAAAQRVASTAMIGADDLIAAADALEIATAGMNAYCDELGSCRKAAGFGSADDPMAQEGVGAFSDPLCVAAFVESQFKRIVAERDALAAELKALREQEPVGIVDEGDDGVFADLETTNGVLVKLGDKLYARPVPAKPVNQSRPLESIESSELRLELHLRAGPRYQCQSKDCKSYEDGPGQFDTCPGCARKGYLCGSFVLDKNSTQYQQWVERTRDKYRGKSGQKNQSPEAGG